MDNKLIDKKKNSIKNLFSSLFYKEGYKLTDYFDLNIWFLRNKITKDNFDSFREIKSKIPSENDDIIKFIIFKKIDNSEHSNSVPDIKIKVEEFINEIVEVLFNLQDENKRVDNLIKLYDAFKTKNLIEQILENPEKLFRNQEIFKSCLKISIEEINNIPKGDYKISLLAGFVNDKINLVETDASEFTIKEEVLEYKLNSLIKVKENKILKAEFFNEYVFPNIDFYSYETQNIISKLDSGTNFLYFRLKIENINIPISKEDDIILSDKKTAIELFLSNFDILLNSFNKNKLFVTEFNVKNIKYECRIKLRLNLELDPWTLASIYSKIHSLLQTTISYKVLTEHKWNTIMYYFEDISDPINSVFNDNLDNKKSDCLIF